jgi:hypothetical protein
LTSIRTASSLKTNSTCHHHGHLDTEWKADLQTMATEENDLMAMDLEVVKAPEMAVHVVTDQRVTDQKADAHLRLVKTPDRKNHDADHLEVNPVATVVEAAPKVDLNPRDLHRALRSSNPLRSTKSKTPLRSHHRNCQKS